MNTLKALFLTLCFMATSQFINANTTHFAKTPETVAIQKILSGLDCIGLLKEDVRVNIKFFVNDQDEIIVVSTSNRILDQLIKGGMNYKKIPVSNLKRGKFYTLPVVFKVS